jgi:hypothetical protein
LVKNHLRWVQALLLPSQTTLDRPVKYARKFRCQFNTKVFVLLFGSKGTVERNSLDTTPDAVVSIIDLRETIVDV